MRPYNKWYFCIFCIPKTYPEGLIGSDEMLKFFQSIFGTTTGNGYPESLIKAAIERAVDGTDPWIRAVSGYKKKLRPAVLQAMDHVVGIVDGMAPPMVIQPGNDTADPGLKTFFISTADMVKILDNDRNLTDFRRGRHETVSWIYALLVMEKQEKASFGVGLSGTIIVHDIPQTIVNFASHRLIDPAGSEDETRRQLKKRAFDHLLSLALGRIAIVKTERDHLERYRTLLQAKLDLLKRGEWGFETPTAEERMDAADMEEALAHVETQLQERGGDDRMLELYLGIVVDVLGHPEEHMWTWKETLIVDRMGIKRSEEADTTLNVMLTLVGDSQERSLAVSLVAISADLLQHDDKA